MISSINDLKKLISLCRKSGISHIKLNGIEMTFSENQDLPFKRTTMPITERGAYSEGIITPDTKIPLPEAIRANGDLPELSPEQLLYYSSVPHDQDGNPIV